MFELDVSFSEPPLAHLKALQLVRKDALEMLKHNKKQKQKQKNKKKHTNQEPSSCHINFKQEYLSWSGATILANLNSDQKDFPWWFSQALLPHLQHVPSSGIQPAMAHWPGTAQDPPFFPPPTGKSLFRLIQGASEVLNLTYPKAVTSCWLCLAAGPEV